MNTGSHHYATSIFGRKCTRPRDRSNDDWVAPQDAHVKRSKISASDALLNEEYDDHGNPNDDSFNSDAAAADDDDEECTLSPSNSTNRYRRRRGSSPSTTPGPIPLDIPPSPKPYEPQCLDQDHRQHYIAAPRKRPLVYAFHQRLTRLRDSYEQLVLQREEIEEQLSHTRKRINSIENAIAEGFEAQSSPDDAFWSFIFA